VAKINRRLWCVARSNGVVDQRCQSGCPSRRPSRGGGGSRSLREHGVHRVAAYVTAAGFRANDSRECRWRCLL
jgi:hypothetical protein